MEGVHKMNMCSAVESQLSVLLLPMTTNYRTRVKFIHSFQAPPQGPHYMTNNEASARSYHQIWPPIVDVKKCHFTAEIQSWEIVYV